ncbi:hypothetical protein SAMN02745114_00050 [Eubacterium coprostanoligenes]|uniref:Uncharacterized protein n=1 Tax=Eubacterium coprostanoligenes TaxID=290054 RepID=A0A1T4JSR7_9FIRM|nr:hypothetical protein SAMN02745114_00050 [Eubacterium coprostanoligenes]
MLFKKKPISVEYSVYECSLQVVANKGKPCASLFHQVYAKVFHNINNSFLFLPY